MNPLQQLTACGQLPWLDYLKRSLMASGQLQTVIDRDGLKGMAVRDHSHAAICLGFGPRFQHSTGQAYKGGRNDGVFMQITCDDSHDLDAPGHKCSFGVVKQAQASADLGVLEDRGRPAVLIPLTDVNTGLKDLGLALTTALEQRR
jgi:hypothetical protein